ncbi:hypothetical protein [Streptomyces sp. NPDC003273]|uniref:hypothetical protein n=1 Tax=Streptomyces sp. NPDC003273 TaxID=3364678 RepID=UPI00368FD7AD
MNTVATALARWSPRRQTYDPSRYPFRYAWDFLATDAPTLVPDEIRRRVDTEVRSRPTAHGKRRQKLHDRTVMADLYLQAWLKETGEPEWGTCVALADKYLALHGIEAPPERSNEKPV